MKTLLITYLLIGFGIFSANAQNVNLGARFGALGGSSVALSGSGNIAGNPAGTANSDLIFLGISYESRFSNSDVATKTALAIIPVKGNTFGLLFNSYGFELFKEQQISLSYARILSDRITAGVKFNYHSLEISGFQNQSAFSVEAGVQGKVIDQLILGARIANPNKASYDGAINADLPVLFEIGAAYQFSEKITISTEIEKIQGFDPDVKSGVEYKPLDFLFFRGGLSLKPFRQFGGLGIDYKGFMFDFGVSTHPSLGYTPQLSLSYAF